MDESQKSNMSLKEQLLARLDAGQTVLVIGNLEPHMVSAMEEKIRGPLQILELFRGEKAHRPGPGYDQQILHWLKNFTDTVAPDNRFDVIVVCRVVEFFQDAREFLQYLVPLLKDHGYLMLTVTNIAHGSVALGLLDGKWEFQNNGVLSRNHFHFYNKFAIEALIADAGYRLDRLDRVPLALSEAASKTPWNLYPESVIQYLREHNPEYETELFVINARPQRDASLQTDTSATDTADSIPASDMAQFTYDYELDLSNENSTHTKILNMVPPEVDVLEIGCATGYMTRYLTEQRKCRVVGVEIDGKAAEKARPWCQELIIGDIEQVVKEPAIADRQFDVIIMADVLEHLKDPGQLLKKIRNCLKPDGFMVVSVPNSAHGSLALELLAGKWNYRDYGLMDQTHLQFFDKPSLLTLFDTNGYLISRVDRVLVHPRDTELKTPWDTYPREVTAYLEKVNPEYQTYQFVIKAYPSDETGWKKAAEDAILADQQRIWQLEETIETLQSQLATRTRRIMDYDAEVTQLHRGYQEKISLLEQEKSAIHEGYRRQIQQMNQEVDGQVARLTQEISTLHQDYQNKIRQLETELGSVHRQYQRAISKLEQDLGRISQELEAEKSSARQRISDVEAEKAEIQQRYQAELEQMELKMRGYQNQIRDIQHREEQIHAQLREIQTSLFWKLVMRYRRIIEMVLPMGSRRRRLYGLMIRAMVVLAGQGPRVFMQKVAARLPFKLRRNFSIPTGQPDSSKSASPQPLDISDPLKLPQHASVQVSIVIPVYNQAHHTLKCLQSMSLHNTVPAEVIVVDNASQDETGQILASAEGIRVIHNETNQGFVTACNQGAAVATGQYILFLNNDTEVTSGWLEAMLAPFENENTGIVGAKLIYPDGRLQEAGGIIWKDGTGWNYGRGDDPELPQYNYLKEVDYCSGACLMIRKDLWDRLAGFDTRYAPAYYEDTDLCFSVRNLGYRVVYQPEARIIHYEGASAGTNLNSGYKRFQKINQDKFIQKWAEVLKTSHCSGPDELYLARERGIDRRVLIVDHYVPTHDMDSGSLRMFSLVKLLVEMGHKVVFWPENRAFHERYTRDLQRLGVEALYGAIDFDQYMKAHGRFFDLILLSRPHIAVHFIHAAKKYSNARIVYDTVDLHFLREQRKAMVEVENWKQMELTLARQSDVTLVVSPVEKQILEAEGVANVAVISNIHAPEPQVPPFDHRADLMFIGGFAHQPNEDGIVWFVESILPKIHESLPGVHLYVVGSQPTERVQALQSAHVTVTGYVEDVTPFFEKARVFVSPLRYGAGVKGKIGQSLTFGLPVVTTSVGAEGMGFVHETHGLIADSEDAFAQAVIRVYQDKQLWNHLSENGRQLIVETFSPQVIKDKLKQLF